MRKNRVLHFALSAILMGSIHNATAQNGMSVNSTGTPADASAMLDVSSTNRGLLIPRMTTLQRNNISAPATGLMIYQTDGTVGYYFYNGTVWAPMAGGALSISGTAPINYNSGTSTISITKSNTTTDGYLSSIDWNTFNNKPTLSSFSGTAPVTYDNTTGAIGIGQSTTTTDGYLSSADWNTFNHKLTPNTAIAAGTNTKITYDVNGLVTGGTTPTTFAGYSIADNSAGLAGAISDGTGTGAVVFANSPALTGSPTAPTQTSADNSTNIATTAFVTSAVGAATGTTSSVWNTAGNAPGAAATLGTTDNSDVNFQTGAGTLNISNDAATTTVNVGTGAGAKTVTLGSINGASGTTVQSGTNGITVTAANSNVAINSGTGGMFISTDNTDNNVFIGTGLGTKFVTIGSTQSTSGTTIQSGTQGISMNSNNGSTTLVAGMGSINIGTDNTASPVNIGNGPGTKTVTLGNSNSVSSTTILSGTGGIALNSGSGPVSLGNAASTVGFFDATPVSQQTGDISAALNSFGLVTSGTLPVGSVSGLGTGVGTFLATPNSANLAGAVTDGTGTGAVVFANSPALTGSPTAPTQTSADNSTNIATTAYVTSAVGAATGTTSSVWNTAGNAPGAAVTLGTTDNSDVNFQTGAGTLNISNDGAATAVNVGTGAGAKTVTLGSTNGASSTTIQSGSGDISMTSGTGSIYISNDAANTGVDVGTGAGVKVVTLGSPNTSSSTTIQSGTGGIALNSGSGPVSLGNAGSTVGFFDAAPVSQQTGDISAALSNFGLVTSGTLPVGSVSGLGTDVATFLATPNSANLANALTDETGSSSGGLAVFNNSPTIKKPQISNGLTATGSTTNDFSGSTGAFKTSSGANTLSGPVSGSSLALTSFLNEAKGADIASAGTTDIGAATGNYVNVTGTTTITSLGTVQAGTRRIVNFTGALTLTYNATSLILPGATNITTAAGDVATFVSLGGGDWKCVSYSLAAGSGGGSFLPLAGGTLTDGANIAVGSSTGTKIGTATTQKLGFFNSAPVAQQTGNITTALGNLGLVTSGTVDLTANVGATILPVANGGTNAATSAPYTVFGNATNATAAPSFNSYTVNVQSGGGYTAVNGDFGKLISLSNASAQTLTLPSTAPATGWYIDVQNTGAGTWTISRNGLNIDGATVNVFLATNKGIRIYSNGTGYYTQRGSSSRLNQMIVYTSTSTYTPPPNLDYLIVTVVGGGGGGGGCNSNSANSSASGGGGGSGAVITARLTAATVGVSTITGTVGNAVAGGGAGANNGTAGIASSFGALIVAGGGGRGTGVTNAAGAGGAGGAATTVPGSNAYGIVGQNGGTGGGNQGGAGVTYNTACGGAGGSSQYGHGGQASPFGGATGSLTGAAGTGYGSGGAGGGAVSSTAAGGSGAGGIIIIYEYTY